MHIDKVEAGGVIIAIIRGDSPVIQDVQTALDLMATTRYETDCDQIIIDKSLITESFFDLKTRLAGEILQKYINYHMKIAIVGDFSIYASQSLKDFMYECNNGNDIFFLPTEQSAIDKLSNLR